MEDGEFFIEYEGISKEYFGGKKNTTNNKMELKAAIEGLRALKETCIVNLTTDSKYVMQGITSWIDNWKKIIGKVQLRKM